MPIYLCTSTASVMLNVQNQLVLTVGILNLKCLLSDAQQKKFANSWFKL